MKRIITYAWSAFVFAAFAVFMTLSCVESGAGSSGVLIDITSDSNGLDSDQDGYFSGSGSIEISKGKAVSFEYDMQSTEDDGGITYHAESGRSEYSSDSTQGGTLLYIDTENAYVETVSGGSPVTPPGISPVQGNLQKEASYYWTNGLIDAITGEDWQGGAKTVDWRAEYTYDGSDRLEKRIEGEWSGSSITRHYDVRKYSNFDAEGGYPQDELHYVDDTGDLTDNPTDFVQEITYINTNNLEADDLYYPVESIGRYFLINSPFTEYYVWYSVSGSFDPSLEGKIGIPVYLNTGEDAAVVVSATDSALTVAIDFTVPFAGGTELYIQNVSSGNALDATEGDSGFTVEPNTQGVPDIFSYTYNYGSLSTPDEIDINGEYTIAYTYDVSGNVTQIDFYDNGGTDLFATMTFDIPTGESLTFDDVNPFTSPIGSDIIDRLTVLPW